MNWFKKFWKKLTAPPNPARVLLPRSAISPGKPIKQPGTDFINFTPRAIKVVELARQEADRFNHNFVGTEHLLLGLVGVQGVAINVLTNFGINLETVRAEVEKQIGKGPEQEKVGTIPLTPRVKKVLALADKERIALNVQYLGTEHILLGILREGDGVAARILKNLGLELEKTREHSKNKSAPGMMRRKMATSLTHRASIKCSRWLPRRPRN
jgi:ATP-dependent Clp protease ATP-binding subunit ClpC